MGSEEGVLDCKDRLLNIQEEFLQDAIDKEEMEKFLNAPSKDAQIKRDLAEKSGSSGSNIT